MNGEQRQDFFFANAIIFFPPWKKSITHLLLCLSAATLITVTDGTF